MEVIDLPYDFYSVISYRFYLDSVNERLGTIEKGASRPPKYVTHTPVLFDVWLQWYEKLPYPETTKNEMKEMGEKNIPEEFRDDFKTLEEFYQHYEMLTSEA